MQAKDGLPPRTLAGDALERLRELDWPGNVRELRNTVERLHILAGGEVIRRADVDRLVLRGGVGPDGSAGLLEATTFQEFRERSERAFLLQKLREHEWNVSETARSLDMPRSNLYKKIERYGLEREE